MRAHNLVVNYDDFNDNDKLHHSTFFVTINSNRVWDKTSKEGRAYMRLVGDVLNNFGNYITHRQGFDDNQMNINIKAATEIGGKFHRLHTHVVVQVDHNSNVSVNWKAIVQFFEDHGISGVLVQSKYIKGSGDLDKMLRYIRKQM